MEREKKIAIQHLQFCCSLYKAQRHDGRYFLHEHPANAESWYLDCIKSVADLPGVRIVQGPMCRWGMKAWDAQGEGYVRKETKWMTNCPTLAEELEKTCSNQDGKTWHRHVHS